MGEESLQLEKEELMSVGDSWHPGAAVSRDKQEWQVQGKATNSPWLHPEGLCRQPCIAAGTCAPVGFSRTLQNGLVGDTPHPCEL